MWILLAILTAFVTGRYCERRSLKRYLESVARNAIGYDEFLTGNLSAHITGLLMLPTEERDAIMKELSQHV